MVINVRGEQIEEEVSIIRQLCAEGFESKSKHYTLAMERVDNNSLSDESMEDDVLMEPMYSLIPIPDEAPPISPPDDVQRYADIM